MVTYQTTLKFKYRLTDRDTKVKYNSRKILVAATKQMGKMIRMKLTYKDRYLVLDTIQRPINMGKKGEERIPWSHEVFTITL